METRSERARRLGPATFDHLKKKEPNTRTVTIYLQQDVVDEYNQLRGEIERLRFKKSNGSELSELNERLRELVEQVEDTSIQMRFRAIGRKRYDDLIREHPPTQADHEEHRKHTGQDAPYNVETFPIALIAESCVEPKMTVEQVEILFNGEYDAEGNELTPAWNSVELSEIFLAAQAVNTQNRKADLGPFSDGTRNSGRS